MLRKIPKTMATQHPDNTLPAYWLGREFISTYEEVEECYHMFKDLKVDEYMWDWEGKFVDESVLEKLFRDHYDYFKKNQLGKEKFLTFRLPNIWQERGYRLARAFMNILSNEDLGHDFNFHSPPVFEVILPMTKKVSELIHINSVFNQLAQFKKNVFGSNGEHLERLSVIPLIEETKLMVGLDKFLEDYLVEYTKQMKESLPDLRVFMARSDPAMNTGIVPSVISVKAAMSHIANFEKEKGIPSYSWLGAGSLPFRGGNNPDNYKAIVNEYAGLSSISIQSAFRYDYNLPDVKKAINYYNEHLQSKYNNTLLLDKSEIKLISEINSIFTKEFQQTIPGIAETINLVAGKIPKRRERVLHIGLFGYSRGVGKVKLPRAIKFTGALYSLGIPPELIGTGRGLKELKKRGNLEFLSKVYKHLADDLNRAGHYLNKENLEMLCKKDKVWDNIREDIDNISEFLGEELGPKTTHHFIHRNLVSTVYYKMLNNEDFSPEIVMSGQIRKSLG